jgi:hypothetical protein
MRFTTLPNSINKTVFLVSCGLSLFFLLSCSVSGIAKEKSSYYWYDGKQKKPLSLDRQRWIEFDTDKSRQPSASKEQLLEKKIGSAKVYRLSEGGQTKSIQSTHSIKKSADEDGTLFSEVFDSSGQMKALPGGIIVSFKKDWDEKAIAQWADKQNLVINKPLLRNINLWLINSPSGIETLNLANKITEQGEVNYATPNWWQPATPK